jgi:hypothetical protein
VAQIQARRESIDARTSRITLLADGLPLTNHAVMHQWIGPHSNEASAALTRAIVEAPGASSSRPPAWFWECAPITTASMSHGFECVLVDAPPLARITASAHAFSEPLARAPADQSVVAFDNLGRDARLVVPRPTGGDFPHLRAFLATAPLALSGEFWRVVAAQLLARLESRPRWLSTSGLGVPWVHARIDRRPKYITHSPYRSGPA